MTKKYWIIKGTEAHSENKQELKAIRRILNLKAGFNEAKVDAVDHVGSNEETVVLQTIEAAPPKTWPYCISKGPDHPSLR